MSHQSSSPRIVTKKHQGPAGRLVGRMVAGVAAVLVAAGGVTAAPPEPIAPGVKAPDLAVPKEMVDEAVTAGVAHLLKMQEAFEEGGEKAEWPYEGVYRVRGTIPIGYRIGGTAIAVQALATAPGYEDDKPRQEAIARGVKFICDYRSHPLMNPDDYTGGYDVRGWGYMWGIQTLCRLKNMGRLPAEHAAEADEAVKFYLRALKKIEIPGSGGWNYAIGQNMQGAPSTFMTPTALQALFEAKKAGYEIDEAMVTRALDFLEKCRADSGAVTYSGEAKPGKSEGIPGAVGRMCIVEATLVLAGRGSQKDLRGAVDSFLIHWDRLNERRQQTGTHVAPYGVAPYYFMYAHLYASQAIELMQLSRAEREEYRRKLLNALFRGRDADGTWNDRVFPRSSGYGTACALMCINAAASKPERWSPGADKPPAGAPEAPTAPAEEPANPSGQARPGGGR